jgi:orotidine-5'-phosphate decarboxylase
MINRKEIFAQIQAKESCLCVGLDPDIQRIPAACGVGVDAMEVFCKSIVDATHDLAVAYKPNLAFFEQYGDQGWRALKRIVQYIPDQCMVIADAKRGDIGNTAKRYASAMFDGLGANAITVAPYMGADSVKPFMDGYEEQWTILLALTSNAGADDFEFHGSPPLFERVLSRAQEWGTPDQLMFVVGGTRPKFIARARELAPENFFLVPGIGAQGGDLGAVLEAGWNDQCGLLINASRSILYASKEADFASAARTEASKLQKEMAAIIRQNQMAR